MITEKEFPALRERLRKILKDELALADFTVDSDGDFSFRYERQPMLVILDPDDPSFVWFRGVVHWLSNPHESELSVADSCINRVNGGTKIVKMFRGTEANREGDYIVVGSASIVVDDVATLSADAVERCLWQIKVGKRNFLADFAEAATTPKSAKGAGSIGEPVCH